MAIVCALGMVGEGHAEGANADPTFCRNGLFPASAGAITLATVSPPSADAVQVGEDWRSCSGSSCPVVKPGDRVLLSTTRDGLRCAWHPLPDRDEIGWLPASALRATTERQPRIEDWIGAWTPVDGGPTIRIVRDEDGGSLRVTGDARWTGAPVAKYDGERVVHLGFFAGSAVPATNLLEIEDAGCHVRMQWVGGYLVAADNAGCGGANVRFDGVYRRHAG